MTLLGKVALITGAHRGIEQGIALQLAKAGADIVAADISIDSLAETREAVENTGRKCLCIEVDVKKRDQIMQMVARTVKDMKSLDIAVDNAGVITINPVVDLAEEEWDHVHDVNIKGVFLCCQT